MRKTFQTGMSILLILSLCLSVGFACAPAKAAQETASVTVANAAAPAAEAASQTVLTAAIGAAATPVPATTMAPAKITGSVEGTAVSVEVNDIIVNLDNGNTISFMMNYITETEATPGDRVKIEYAGVVTDRPEAVTVTVVKPADFQSISGEVMLHDDASMFVQISSQEIYGLVVDKDTKITGAATSVVTGDTVTVSFDGNLNAGPTALAIEITNAVKNRKEKVVKADDLTNKELDGYVTRLSSKAVSIRTVGKGRTYAFKRDSTTVITGSYELEVGARVVVTYDGYATKKPLATRIRVIAPPDPTPTASPVKSKTATGIVVETDGIHLLLDNGQTYDCTHASYGGNGSGIVGDTANVTYYVGDESVKYATYVNFTAPQPKPTPPKTTSGTVTSFGGMYLSLLNGMGFDCAYASYGGNGNRVEGEYAEVTYYVGDDGMNYATRIVFTAVDDYPLSDFDLDPSLGEPDPEWIPDDYEDEGPLSDFDLDPSLGEPDPEWIPDDNEG